MNELGKLPQIFLDHPEFLHRFICNFFPIPLKTLYKYRLRWFWCDICSNQQIQWSEKLIEDHLFYLDWLWLSQNPKLPWTTDFICKYEDKWDWSLLSYYASLLTPYETIGNFYNKWDWTSLSENENIHWTDEVIDTYKEKWDRTSLSANLKLPWSYNLLDKYKEKWSWDSLYSNEGIPWNDQLIGSFKDKLNNMLTESDDDYYDLTDKQLEKYSISGELGGFSDTDEVLWTEEVIEKYKEYWVWEGVDSLSTNIFIPWTLDLLVKYEDRLDWNVIFLNSKIWDDIGRYHLTESNVEHFIKNSGFPLKSLKDMLRETKYYYDKSKKNFSK